MSILAFFIHLVLFVVMMFSHYNGDAGGPLINNVKIISKNLLKNEVRSNG